jgi:uncharacterized protein (DUF1015 family)
VEPLSSFCTARTASSDRAPWPQESPDDKEGFFIYRQDFRTEAGLDKSRLGLVGLLGNADDAQVYTTQDTEPFGVEECINDITKTGIQESPVIAGVEDLHFELEKLLERAMGSNQPPDVELEPSAGDHRIWKIEDPILIEDVRAFFRGKDCFLLDGLHTYRALLRLRDRAGRGQQKEGGADAPSPLFPMTMFLNYLDFGVNFRGVSILVKEIANFSINDLALRMNALFDIKTYPFEGLSGLPRALTDFREDLRVQGFTDRVVGACFHGLDQFFLFTLRGDVDAEKVFLPDVRALERGFDSTVLRRVILERYIRPGVSAQTSLEYTWSPEEAIAAVRAGKFQAAFLLNPPNKRKLLRLAREGLRLPPGAARLEPPVHKHLVMKRV